MIAELMAMEWWWLLPLVGLSYDQQENSGKQEAQSTSRSTGRSMSQGISQSLGKAGSLTSSQTGIGAAFRPQFENLVNDLMQRFNKSPLISSLTNMGTPQIPALNASGLYPAQETLLPELVRLATSPISAGMASRGMVSPENTAEVGGGVAKALAPTLLPIISKNIADAAILPGQAYASSVSPFTNLLSALTQLLGGTSTGVSLSEQRSFAEQLAQAMQDSESQSTSSGSQESFGFGVGLGNNAAGGAAATAAMCWIAEAIYGTWAWETFFLRYWFVHVWAERSFVGRCVVAAYRRYGQWVAGQVRKRAWVRAMMRPLFAWALRTGVREVLYGR